MERKFVYIAHAEDRRSTNAAGDIASYNVLGVEKKLWNLHDETITAVAIDRIQHR